MWVVDPLDGTTNFIHRFPMFCVTIAAVINNKVEVAVTYHPILDDLYTSIRGEGAFINHKRMKVSSTAKIRDALFTTGFAYRDRSLLNTEMSTFSKVSNAARAVRRRGRHELEDRAAVAVVGRAGAVGRRPGPLLVAGVDDAFGSDVETLPGDRRQRRALGYDSCCRPGSPGL